MKTHSKYIWSISKIILLMLLFVSGSLTVEAAHLKFVPQVIFQQGGEGNSRSGRIPENTILNKAEIITLAMKTVNRFEDYRDFPDSFTSEAVSYPVQQLVKVFADAILAINNGDTSLSVTLNSNIVPALYFYINIVPDSAVYEIPLSKNEYLALCTQIQQQLSGSVVLPNVFNVRNSVLRSVETLYLLASILRYYDFYDKLPDFNQIMLTPKGLVPWNLSDSHRIYTSMNSGQPSYYLQTNNYYNVGKFESFKIAKRIIGTTTNSYNAGNKIYDHIISRWRQGGYKIWIKPFQEPDYAFSNYRFNLSNSASQYDKINMLLRSIGLPCSNVSMWDDLLAKWINIDVHKPYGDEPYGNPVGTDSIKPIEKFSPLIDSIRQIVTYNNDSTAIPDKYIWINAEDIVSQNPASILQKCHTAGINNIILTIKSSSGFFYYPTEYNRMNPSMKYQDSAYNLPRFKFDAITPLTNISDNYGIKILPAISILNDYFMASASWSDFGLDSVNNWMTYMVGDTNWKIITGRLSISACVEAYKDSTIKYLKEISNLPGISGIVLGSLYMNTTSYAIPLDGNPNCACYNSDSAWQSTLLRNYAIDLINAIKSENTNLKVILSSYPVGFSNYNDFEGMQDKGLMKNLADAYLVPIGYSQWLMPLDSFAITPQSPSPFLLEDYVSQLSIGAEKPIIVSISLKDEWIYPPDFYTGLAKKMIQAGASSTCFHNFNSLEGEWGSAFNAFQYSTLNALNFESFPEIIVKSPNRKEIWFRGSTYNITWFDNINENVKIELFKDGIYHSTIVNSAPSAGSYSWAIPPEHITGSDFQVKIISTVDTNVVDISNTNFSIFCPNFSAGSVSPSQIIPYNTAPATLTSTNPIGGITPYNYQWQYSLDNSQFSIIAGANNPNLIPGTLTNTTWYRQLQGSANGCGPFATNSIKITIAQAPCTGIPSLIYSGQTYNTVQIGDQCWLKENLNLGKRIDNNLYQSDNDTIEKYCYNNLDSNCNIYGGLYQWDEMMLYETTQGTKGICPQGWHIPSIWEWDTLIVYLGGQSIAGGKLKETGFKHWASPNTDATNESGFMALPGGGTQLQQGCFGLSNNGYFWTSNSNLPYKTGLSLYNNYGGISANGFEDSWGLTVRCLKDNCATYSTVGVFINASATQVCTGVKVNFIATAIHGGTPIYQWKVNGINSGTGENKFSYIPSNNDVITCTVFSNLPGPCISGSPAVSNAITMIVNPALQVDVSIVAQSNAVYSGSPATFFATATNGGSSPSFQWKVNGMNTGTNTSTLTYIPENEDIVTCVLNSSEPFTCNNPAFSNQIMIFLINPCPELPNIIYGGQTYNTVLIGNQCWLKENLNIGTRIDGSIDQSDNGVLEKHCYNNLEDNCSVYGGLYQWDEFMQYETAAGSHGICPQGWHVPTDVEWTTLTTYLGNTSCSINIAGGKMKESGILHWNEPNTAATNSSGFSALPAGLSFNSGVFFGIYENGTFGSSTSFNESTVSDWGLYFNNAGIFSHSNDKSVSYSVRCIKGESPLPQNRLIQNTSVPDGSDNCFDATQTISVAGNGTTFTVQNGGRATMIAGQKILYHPGTAVFNGGYMWGYVSPSGPWCGTLAPSITTAPIEVEEISNSSDQPFFKVYPNPTTGLFIIELTEGAYSEQSHIEIYDIWGCKIKTAILSNERKHEFTLSEKPVGVYFIRVISGDKAETVKIVKQ